MLLLKYTKFNFGWAPLQTQLSAFCRPLHRIYGKGRREKGMEEEEMGDK